MRYLASCPLIENPLDRQWNTVDAFARPFFVSLDVDPWSLLVKAVGQKQGLERALWYEVLVIAFSHVGSAIVVFNQFPDWERFSFAPWMGTLPIGQERRGFRSTKNLHRHLDSFLAYARAYGSLAQFLMAGFGENPFHNFSHFMSNIQKVWGNGRWAAFEFVEAMINGLSANIRPSSVVAQGSTGPRRGIETLFRLEPGSWPDARLDEGAERLRQTMAMRYSLTLSVTDMETFLCDYQATLNGRYYVGHHIDEQLEQLLFADKQVPGIAGFFMEVRSTCLPWNYLGEKMGWTGPSKALKRLYKDHFQVGDRAIHGDTL